MLASSWASFTGCVGRGVSTRMRGSRRHRCWAVELRTCLGEGEARDLHMRRIVGDLVFSLADAMVLVLAAPSWAAGVVLFVSSRWVFVFECLVRIRRGYIGDYDRGLCVGICRLAWYRKVRCCPNRKQMILVCSHRHKLWNGDKRAAGKRCQVSKRIK